MLVKNLRTKLWLSIVTVVVIFVIMLGFLLMKVFENFYFNQTANNLIYNGQQLTELILREQEIGRLREEVELLSEVLHARIMISDREGLVQARGGMGGMMNMGSRLSESELQEVLKGDILVKRGFHRRFETAMLSVIVPIKQNQQVIGAVLLYAPVQSITEPLGEVKKLIYYVAIGAVLVATVLSFFLAQWLTGPITNMNKVALAMAKGNFREKVDVTSEDEIGVLGQTLNFLSQELEQNIDLLSQEKNQLGNILTSMTDGVVTFNNDGQVILINPQARHLLKVLNDFEPGQSLSQCCPFPEVKNIFNKVVAEGLIEDKEIKTKDFILAVRMAPLKQERGEIRGVVAVFQDVTKERKLEELRREFVANVSHELRTPLTYLQGYTELLLDGMAQSENEKNKYLNIILDESLRLKRLVNELLDLTQLQTGHLIMKKELVDITALAEKVTFKLKTAAETRGITIRVVSEENLPLISGDEDRLEQVLINLLDNSVRYSPQGEEVRVALLKSKESLEVRISDRGQGIPEEELASIWERFYKVDKARTRDQGGTGLGLAIVKNIIEAHHGRVGVESVTGKGTTFWFQLPIKTNEVAR